MSVKRLCVNESRIILQVCTLEVMYVHRTLLFMNRTKLFNVSNQLTTDLSYESLQNQTNDWLALEVVRIKME